MSPALLAELVRLPALLSVPGDALLGAAAAAVPRGATLAVSSGLVYAGGMALNDVADALVDALERPGRPVPSGRVPLRVARRTARGLLGAGLLAAGALGGRPALRVAVPLVAAVVAYDTRAKGGARGAAVMAACRGLDVLLGAAPAGPRGLVAALPAAGVVAVHTATVTALSAREVDGADADLVRATRRRVLAVAAAAPLLALPRGRRAVLLASVGSAAYLAQCVPALGRAERSGGAADAQAAVGACVVGVVPLQAGLLAAHGAPLRGAGVLGLLLMARRAARRRSAT